MNLFLLIFRDFCEFLWQRKRSPLLVPTAPHTLESQQAAKAIDQSITGENPQKRCGQGFGKLFANGQTTIF